MLADRFIKLVLLAVLLLGTAPNSKANSLAIDFTSPTPGKSAPSDNWILGWEFNVVQSLTVTSLGFYDDGKDGLINAHDVGIFDSSGNLLIWTTVQNSDPLTNWFHLAAVTPTVLLPGPNYRIAATSGQEVYTWDPMGFTSHSAIEFVRDRWDWQSTILVYPTQTFDSRSWFGPNFELSTGALAITHNPEPSTILLMATGFIAVLGLAARRKALRRGR